MVIVECLSASSTSTVNIRLHTHTFDKVLDVRLEVCIASSLTVIKRLRFRSSSDNFPEQVIYDLKGDVIMCDPEDEMNVFNGEKMSKSQQLYLMWELLPVMTKTTKKRSSTWIPKLKTQV
ncbi:hypothetical protein HanLR1_Chr09g0303021 [Helianthus annuus]|nr:hypothetical protein HanLR1_Chr09g0303021 [Helianthus annuus]